MNLFDDEDDDDRERGDPASDPATPLAERMRPRTLAEVRGQTRWLAEGAPLRRALESDEVFSLVFWGPPGCGKTTLARLIAQHTAARFVAFSAVLSGVADIRRVMAEAERARRARGTRTVLFVDEIHRFNKAQQDAFLPYIERGDIVLVGATTENPSFELNAALLSRARVLRLEPLSVDDLVDLLAAALQDAERGLGALRVRSDPETLTRLAHLASGDARCALTLLENAARYAAGRSAEPVVDAALLERMGERTLLHDKQGEEHYNLISALHKSVRNGDVDAALYWLARLLEAGEDPKYVGRRLIRMASEDVGLADPRSLGVAVDAFRAVEILGIPEGKLALAQAVAHLALVPKSNHVYRAYEAAADDARHHTAEPVPLHLRNAATRLLREEGYGRGYRYAHDDPAAADEMRCLPESLADRVYYEGPGSRSARAKKSADSDRKTT